MFPLFLVKIFCCTSVTCFNLTASLGNMKFIIQLRFVLTPYSPSIKEYNVQIINKGRESALLWSSEKGYSLVVMLSQFYTYCLGQRNHFVRDIMITSIRVMQPLYYLCNVASLLRRKNNFRFNLFIQSVGNGESFLVMCSLACLRNWSNPFSPMKRKRKQLQAH